MFRCTSTITEIEAAIEKLPEPINTGFEEGHSSVSADGGILVFHSARPGGREKRDIYVSFTSPEGRRSVPIDLGGEINSSGNDQNPTLTLDGRCLFYVSDRSGKTEYYWVDAGILDKFRPTIRNWGGRVNEWNTC